MNPPGWYQTPFEMITRTMGIIIKAVINVFFGYNVVNQHNLLKICSIRKAYYYFTWYFGCILPLEKNTDTQKNPTSVN